MAALVGSVQVAKLPLPLGLACRAQRHRAHLALLLLLQPWVMRCWPGLFHRVRFDHANGSTAQIVAASVVSKDPTISRRAARIDFFPREADPPIRYLLSALRLCESYRRRWSVRLTSYRDGCRWPANRRNGFSPEPRRVCAYREVRCPRTPRHRPASKTVKWNCAAIISSALPPQDRRERAYWSSIESDPRLLPATRRATTAETCC
jgi:hypothetical protein